MSHFYSRMAMYSSSSALLMPKAPKMIISIIDLLCRRFCMLIGAIFLEMSRFSCCWVVALSMAWASGGWLFCIWFQRLEEFCCVLQLGRKCMELVHLVLGLDLLDIILVIYLLILISWQERSEGKDGVYSFL